MKKGSFKYIFVIKHLSQGAPELFVIDPKPSLDQKTKSGEIGLGDNTCSIVYNSITQTEIYRKYSYTYSYMNSVKIMCGVKLNKIHKLCVKALNRPTSQSICKHNKKIIISWAL